jgi:hypothetical protein
LLKRLPFLHCMFLAPFSKIGGCSCVDSYWIIFSSTGPHMCFCASTIPFVLLCLCSIIWSPIFIFSCIFLIIHGLLCFQINFKVDVSTLWWMSLGF